MTAADVHAAPAHRSFRDPAGTLYRFPDRILRAVQPAHIKDLQDFLATSAARDASEDGRLVRSAPVPPSEYPELDARYLWEHERIPFPSFPYEWPPEMLHAAATLTLDLAEAALKEGFGLKDATPYNVLFRGACPVFVDVLSFERRDPLDSTWMAYGQFVRTFLLPLMASRYLVYRWTRSLPAGGTVSNRRRCTGGRVPGGNSRRRS